MAKIKSSLSSLEGKAWSNGKHQANKDGFQEGVGDQGSREGGPVVKLHGREDPNVTHKDHGLVQFGSYESMEVYIPSNSREHQGWLTPIIRPNMVKLAKPMVDVPH